MISRAEVISKVQTYLPKISSATPDTLPVLSLTLARPFIGAELGPADGGEEQGCQAEGEQRGWPTSGP